MARIRPIKPTQNGSRIRLRFTYEKTPYSFTIKDLVFADPLDFRQAEKICQQIQNDCELNCFDSSLERYGKEAEKPLEAPVRVDAALTLSYPIGMNG